MKNELKRLSKIANYFLLIVSGFVVGMIGVKEHHQAKVQAKEESASVPGFYIAHADIIVCGGYTCDQYGNVTSADGGDDDDDDGGR